MFVNPMNSTRNPLEKHETLFSKKKEGEMQMLDMATLSKRILN